VKLSSMPKKKKIINDVIVIGAGASGATFAALLAEEGKNVLLLDTQDYPFNKKEITWLSPYALPILEQAKVSIEEIVKTPISSCTFYNSDFSKTTHPELPEEKVFLITQSQLSQAIVDALLSKESGQFKSSSRVKKVEALENGVAVLMENGSRVEGRLLVLATGLETRLLEQLGLSLSQADGSGLWMACYYCPALEDDKSGVVDYILGVDGGGGFGYRIALDDTLAVGICLASSGNRAVSELIQISNRMVEQGLLPGDWQAHAAGTSAVWSPAGVALEVESHVTKHTLTIGRVGGFVSSYANESLYPGMWSAQLAVKVVCEALMSGHPQDKLREYERLWRTTMADHLRSPNTDAQSLLPLIFSNQQMADKMLQSLQFGVNF